MGFNRLTKIPSLNLASIAANIDENICEVKVADLVVKESNPRKALLKILNSYKPDVVGLTAMSFQYQTALELARLIRKFSHQIIIVMGGYHVTADWENILTSEDKNYFDFLIDGEGEVPFNELMKSLVNGQDYLSVPGIIYLKDGQIQKNSRPALLPPEEIKLPKRNARIFNKGFHIMGKHADVIETSRGCVYDCNFCSIRNMYGKSFRKFSIDRIITDLEDAKSYGAKSIFITEILPLALYKAYHNIPTMSMLIPFPSGLWINVIGGIVILIMTTHTTNKFTTKVVSHYIKNKQTNPFPCN